MKRVSSTFILFCILLDISGKMLSASITFGSRDSAINIVSGARFNNSSDNLSIDGTFKHDAGSDISGNPMAFDQGVLENEGLEALMQGQYDPTGSDFVRLQGNSRFRAEPGTLLQSMTIEGINNRVEGQPLFSSNILLVDASTEVEFAIQNRLNKGVVLNGGTVKLNDDLGLADEIKFIGNGRIELNDRQLRLGSMYSAPWGNSLYFNDAADITLDCKLSLTGTWTFGGTSCLTGNGGVLDLSQGGQIIIDNDSSLTICDLHITGLADGAGRIIFRNGGSILRTANSTYKLNDDVTTDQGTFYVCGPTTFQIGDNDWTFNNNANLTVDGTTLWLDPLDSPCFTGVINAPFPLFTPAGWSGPNLLADLASGNLSLINRGTIKEVVDTAQIGFNLGQCEIDHGITGTVDFFDCICLGNGDRIDVIGDACINGNGVEVAFTNQLYSQFIVREGVTVLLTNIKFTHINDKTFDLRENSAIRIGSNVIFELETDMTFSANAQIEVTNGSENCTLIDGCNVFKIRGEKCRRKFHIQPFDDQQPNGQPRKNFILGHNTVMLEQAEISGLDFVFFFSDDLCSAAVALSCNAGADLYSNFPNGQNKFGTAMNFFVEGSENELILRQDGFVLSGNISFGDCPDNELNMRFNFSTFLDPLDPRRDGVLPGFPVVELSGDPGIFLFSSLSSAQLNFVDFNAAVRNSNGNAFIVDDNGILMYKRLQILDNPIKQQSARFRFEGLELLGERIDPGFIRMHRNMLKSFHVTAAHIMRQQEREMFEKAAREAKERAKISGHSAAPNPKAKKPRKQHRKKANRRDEIVGLVFDEKETNESKMMTRALSLPVSFDQTYVDQDLTPATPITGNIDYNRVTLNNFMVDPEQPFNIRIQNGTIVTLGADVVLNENHKINVQGVDNVIRLAHNMTIGPDNLFLDEGAKVKFEFPAQQDQTELTIANSTIIDVEQNAVIEFSGPGVVTLQDGVIFNFKGIKNIHPVTKAETIVSRGLLKITEKAIMHVAADAQARMQGVGQIDVDNDGTLLMDQANSRLIFGLDIPTINGLLDGTPSERVHDIVLDVFDNGVVRLLGDSPRISFRYLSSDIRFRNGGSLNIRSTGVFELNANDGTPTPSRVKNFSLQGGVLSIVDDGIFLLGENKVNVGTGQPFPFSYNGIAATFFDQVSPGIVGYVNILGGDFFETFNVDAARADIEVPAQTFLGLANALTNQ